MVAAFEAYDETNFLQLHSVNDSIEVQVPKCHLDLFYLAQVGGYGIPGSSRYVQFLPFGRFFG